MKANKRIPIGKIAGFGIYGIALGMAHTVSKIVEVVPVPLPLKIVTAGAATWLIGDKAAKLAAQVWDVELEIEGEKTIIRVTENDFPDDSSEDNAAPAASTV